MDVVDVLGGGVVRLEAWNERDLTFLGGLMGYLAFSVQFGNGGVQETRGEIDDDSEKAR